MLKHYKLTFFILLFPFLLVSQDLTKKEIGKNFIAENAKNWGLSTTDINQMLVTNQFETKHNGVTHIYFTQTYNGIPVQGAIINLNITKDNEIPHYGNNFVPELRNKINHKAPTVGEQEALKSTFGHFGLTWNGSMEVSKRTNSTKAIYKRNQQVTDDVFVELNYLVEGQKALLVWDVTIQPKTSISQYHVYIDAKSGQFYKKLNTSLHCSFPAESGHRHDHNCEQTHLPNNSSSNAVEAAGDGATYRVYALPAASPLYGEHEIVTDPSNEIASPFGWHDTNGEEGPEFTITRGNNAHAYEDFDATNSPSDEEPDGGADLVFDFTHDVNADPIFSRDASATQLFYMVNMVHDFAYLFGFDEAAGNYQENNYGNGGQGSDFVRANSLDQSIDPNTNAIVTNNAVWSGSPEGSNPLMTMYLWDKTAGLMEVTEPAAIAGIKDVGAYGNGGDFEWGIVQDDYDIEGDVALAFDDSIDGTESLCCSSIVNDVAGKIAFIDRGECLFSTKAWNAQQAGAIGVIICNFEDVAFGMAAGDDFAPDITIPGVGMASSDCNAIRASVDAGINVHVVIKQSSVQGPDQLDGAFDNGIVAHEYAHGISGRLVGGSTSGGCLINYDTNNDGTPDSGEQMGEGWSDFFTLVMTVQDGDTGAESRGIGTYANSEGAEGRGIRRFPYSTDMEISPYTYDDIKTGSVPHGVGEPWCATLWDLYWAMVDEYGYDSDLTNTESGNFRAMLLVMDGLKMTACRPGYIDGRDAILAADEVNFDGVNQCLIWNVFARRGVGFYADGGNANNQLDGTEDFEPLPTCIEELKIAKTATDRILPGEDIEVTLDIANHKKEAVSGVVATDDLPSGLSLIPGSESFPATIEGNTLTFDIGDMASLDEIQITYTLGSDPDNISVTNVFDDLEATNPNWGIEALEGYDVWGVTSLESYSGDLSYFVGETIEEIDQVLIYSDLEIVGSNPVLRFFHNYNTELGSDAGFVQVSTDGAVWQSLENDFILGGYNGIIQYSTFAIPNLFAFSGRSDGWVPAYISLADYVGQTVSIRFRFGTDDNTISDDESILPGWYLDDFELLDLNKYIATSCITSNEGDNRCAIPNETLIDPLGDIVGVESLESEGYSMNLQPNPTSEYVTVAINSELRGPVNVSINSAEGKTLTSKSVEIYNDKTFINFDTNHLVSGFYFVILEANSKVLTQKLLIH